MIAQVSKTEFGKIIRELRVTKKLTQEKLAELSDCHPRYIQKVESGKALPSLTLIFKLSQALGMRPFELIKIFEESRIGKNIA